ncbi:23S rRNA (guanosine(2251)-2'-O)-methyltransferase RlmB [Clostridium sp. 19966]|uniref:23S rRNA (guanosine(2251)-2'-O)-methyltransferase RlmB n=1 Tax=Clostridium sp. 19966 TaxID=2768166 RepID=UPI0028E00056|nr:23S rRNA (guanosine(2251)-2'-O)-methyltransferase RlmB [Clostridium sp. 19966]MDT8715796.1 23S rRNA (guanosine(2251)-2'-O)-methyltransferase RlmB [Clostridium sp. 19966]
MRKSNDGRFKDKRQGYEEKNSLRRNKSDEISVKPRKKEQENRAVQPEVREDLIEGRNAVIEALRSDRTIENIYIAKGEKEGAINVVLGIAKEKNLVIKEVDRKKLDSMSSTGNHQGVIAQTTPYKYYEVEDILKAAKEKNEAPFIIILDELEDPHNLGSIIRTAEVCGAHGIIIPKRRNVGVTAAVYRSSVGAVEYMKIAKVTNINACIEELKKNGVWVYGCDMDGSEFSFETNFKGSVALVVGSEGNGISRLTKEKCDKIIKIPMVGHINSLNASVAAGIMMYEVLKSRIK